VSRKTMELAMMTRFRHVIVVIERKAYIVDNIGADLRNVTLYLTV
jgi:hypothetical protein